MSVELRKAQHQDIGFLWYLRNQPDVYQYFKHPEPVPWEEHVAWVMQYLLEFRPSALYVIQYETLSAGQVRLDYENNDAIISISLLKEFRGKGIAFWAVELSCELVKSGGYTHHILAEIHKDNVASVKLFEKAGFLQEGQNGDLLKLVRTI